VRPAIQRLVLHQRRQKEATRSREGREAAKWGSDPVLLFASFLLSRLRVNSSFFLLKRMSNVAVSAVSCGRCGASCLLTFVNIRGIGGLDGASFTPDKGNRGCDPTRRG
jgi:hypothetical protein